MARKYNAKKVTQDGYTFDSKSEYARYQELRLLQQACVISHLVVHPKYMLQDAFIDDVTGEKHRAITYEADFGYREDGKEVVEDVKGFSTDVFKIKWKMFRKQYPGIDARIVKV